ncbi:DUF1761 domain-containing protein [Novosphingobium sp. Gsoil 351]|uniref:DUF1761 domain-containing protein n=1 Tax=Novosphingobium sp. Gsoil 351 TaxID=2675225 RepID=UPI0012B44EC0|nr:DUF1761 domain-containing protein [Novosphingobium sp. Gsoil 351]QGN55957.1 DUF1761 family protein [Novosphingobium sp. Gsoil 351]
MNWLAAILAAVFAFGVGGLWYGPLFGRAKLEEVGPGGLAARRAPARTLSITAALLVVSATMMAHMFARFGEGTLAAKPWLYFMMSGGLALAFVVPALLISYTHQRLSTRLALIDAGYWVVSYLAMGVAFWLVG